MSFNSKILKAAHHEDIINNLPHMANILKDPSAEHQAKIIAMQSKDLMFYIDIGGTLKVSITDFKDFLSKLTIPSGVTPVVTVAGLLSSTPSSGEYTFTPTVANVGALSTTYTVTVGTDNFSGKINIIVPATAKGKDDSEVAGDDVYWLDLFANDIGVAAGAKIIIDSTDLKGVVVFDEAKQEVKYTAEYPIASAYTLTYHYEHSKVSATATISFAQPTVTIKDPKFSTNEDTDFSDSLLRFVTGFKDNLHEIALMDASDNPVNELALHEGTIKLDSTRGGFKFTLKPNLHGTSSFKFAVLDKFTKKPVVSDDAEMAVTSVEDKPEIYTTQKISIDLGKTNTFKLNDKFSGLKDGDGEDISVASCGPLSDPSIGSFNTSGGEFVAAQAGAATFNCKLKDAKGTLADQYTPFEVEVTAASTPPTSTPPTPTPPTPTPPTPTPPTPTPPNPVCRNVEAKIFRPKLVLIKEHEKMLDDIDDLIARSGSLSESNIKTTIESIISHGGDALKMRYHGGFANFPNVAQADIATTDIATLKGALSRWEAKMVAGIGYEYDEVKDMLPITGGCTAQEALDFTCSELPVYQPLCGADKHVFDWSSHSL